MAVDKAIVLNARAIAVVIGFLVNLWFFTILIILGLFAVWFLTVPFVSAYI
jgi:hypothetical protein